MKVFEVSLADSEPAFALGKCNFDGINWQCVNGFIYRDDGERAANSWWNLRCGSLHWRIWSIFQKKLEGAEQPSSLKTCCDDITPSEYQMSQRGLGNWKLQIQHIQSSFTCGWLIWLSYCFSHSCCWKFYIFLSAQLCHHSSTSFCLKSHENL